MWKRVGLILTLVLSLLSAAPAKAAPTACPTTYCNLANTYLKFGSGSENSINSGAFLQAPYYMVPTNVWRQFTWNATAFLTRYGVASGGTGWNTNVLSAESPVGTVTYDYSGFVATATAGSVTTGYGTISTSNTITLNSISFTIKQDFILGQTSRFLKVMVTVTNNSSSTAANFNQWVGPQDDYAAACDNNLKTRGHIANDTFTAISAATDANQNAVKVTCATNPSESVFLTSPISGTKSVIPSGTTRFTGVPTTSPLTSPITESSDNGYGIQIPYGDIAGGGSSSAVWYLTGGINSDLAANSVLTSISAPLAPSVTSMIPSVAANNNLTNSGSFSYNLVFSSAVTGLIAGDFSLSGTGSSTCSTPTISGSGTTYTVSLSGCSEGTVITTLNSNSVADASNNTGPLNSYSAATVRIDQTGPTVSSAIPVNGTYSATGTSALNVTVVFSESVTVTGTPRIPITIGTTSRFANYVSMTDSKTATFRFTVTVDYNDIDLDGIAVNSPLDPNSGTIADLAANAMSTFSFTPPSSTTAYVYQPPSAPTIDSITANNTSLTVYFTAGAANGSTVSNYQFSTNNGGSFSVLSPTDAVSPITITGLTNGTTYQIIIKAISNLGVGLASNMVASAPTASASVSISLTASATTANKGTPITITAQVNQAGVITFFWNGERIPGCIKKPATTSATCIWKPAVTGQWSISALLDPTDPTYVDSYSPKLPVFILRRSGTR